MPRKSLFLPNKIKDTQVLHLGIFDINSYSSYNIIMSQYKISKNLDQIILEKVPGKGDVKNSSFFGRKITIQGQSLDRKSLINFINKHENYRGKPLKKGRLWGGSNNNEVDTALRKVLFKDKEIKPESLEDKEIKGKVIEDLEIGSDNLTKLGKLINDQTADIDTTQNRPGRNVVPGDTYKLLNIIRVVSDFNAFQDFDAKAHIELLKEFPDLSIEEKYLYLSFDEACFGQGSVLSGVADFKMGMFQQNLIDANIPFYWRFMNDEAARLFIPLGENEGKIFQLMEKISTPSFIEQLFQRLQDQPSVQLNRWGLTARENITTYSLKKEADHLVLSVTPQDELEIMKKVIEQQWKKATVEINGDVLLIKGLG